MATSSTALNLEAISKAIRQHDERCTGELIEIQMNPFEVERLDFESFQGIPIVGDREIGTGRFRLRCERDEVQEKEAAKESVPAAA